MAYEEESIHSYFLRTLLCLGTIHKESDLQGIVSQSGVIRALPRVNATNESIFSSLSNEALEKLITFHSTYSGLKYYSVDDVRSYMLHSKDFPILPFPPDAHSLVNFRTQLRYCPECFKEQILQNGVSWFRLAWLHSTECSLHNQRLCHVNRGITECCSHTTNMYSELLSALNGKCYYCQESAWSNSKRVFIGDFNRSQYLVLRNENLEQQEHYRNRHDIKRRELEYSRIRQTIKAMKEKT